MRTTFLSLPGVSFTVTGSKAPTDSILASLGSELLLTSAVSVGAKFDTQLAGGSLTYVGTANGAVSLVDDEKQVVTSSSNRRFEAIIVSNYN